MASIMHLFNFMQPKILNKIFIKMNSKMISKEKRYHSQTLSLIAHKEIKSARNSCDALIIAANISKRSLNFDFQTKETNS
jgi:hypothetical protein